MAKFLDFSQYNSAFDAGFLRPFVDYRMDPGRRLYDQMVMAARCGVANIAEGSARHSTSIETEMRLLDKSD